jgi:hypothetical protein
LLLQKHKINEALNILYFIVKRDGAERSCTGKKHRRKEYWLTEKYEGRKRKRKEALSELKDEVSINYLEAEQRIIRL